MNEIWKWITGYEGKYKVSSLGRIMSYAQNSNGKIKNGYKDKKGYLTIYLYDSDGNGKWYKIHRLVGQAFIPNPNNLPQINHKDEDKTNNCVDNLEWCDNWYNCHYGTKIERAVKSNYCCPTTSKKIYSIDQYQNKTYYDSIGEAERETGLSHCNIVRALKGRRPRCGNCEWFYA